MQAHKNQDLFRKVLKDKIYIAFHCTVFLQIGAPSLMVDPLPEKLLNHDDLMNISRLK